MMSVTSVPERTGMLWWRATLDMLPLSISVTPWGILCGALALQAGLSPLQAQLMSLLVYAGAAQLSATTLFGAGTPLLPIMSSTMVITSQHLLYGFTFRRDVLPLSLRWRASLAFFLTDEMFAVALKDRERSGHFDPATRSSRDSSSICSGIWRPCSASRPASTSMDWTAWGWILPSRPPSSP